MIKCFIFLAGLSLSLAIKLGPLIESTVRNPNVVKHNGVYYTISDNSNYPESWLTLRSSYDLRNWVNETYIFNNDTKPVWMDPGLGINAAKLYVLGDNDFRIYFYARDSTYYNEYQAGVAYAKDILGPYQAVDKPFHYEGFTSSPALLNDNGELYLIWQNSSRHILGRKLQSDGLATLDDQVYLLIDQNDAWAASSAYGITAVAKNDRYYIFYYTLQTCKVGNNGIGVLRTKKSSGPLGPYESLDKPILASTKEVGVPRSTSVAKFLDDSTDMLFFGAYNGGDSPCTGDEYRLYTRDLQWGDDEWPYVPDES